MANQTGSVLGKYLEDRGPHLAAMVAYYALLSLFPFLFLVLSTLGVAGQIVRSSALVKRARADPAQSESVHDLLNLVRSVQANAGTFFVIGFVGILWSTLGFYSALESMLNIVFRVNNRGFSGQVDQLRAGAGLAGGAVLDAPDLDRWSPAGCTATSRAC